VINGDWFDFLQVLELPTTRIARRSASPRTTSTAVRTPVFGVGRGISNDGDSRRPPDLLPVPCRLRGGGNQLKIIKGNHDVHLFWPRVQRRLSSHIVSLAPVGRHSITRSNIEILPGLYHSGFCMWSTESVRSRTAFRNFLAHASLLPPRADPHLELDLSSLLVRYLTNRVEPFNPLADNIRPLSDFYLMLLRKHPIFALQTFGTALRFVWKASAKASELSTGRRAADSRRYARRTIAESRPRPSRSGPGPAASKRLSELSAQLPPVHRPRRS